MIPQMSPAYCAGRLQGLTESYWTAARSAADMDLSPTETEDFEMGFDAAQDHKTCLQFAYSLMEYTKMGVDLS